MTELESAHKKDKEAKQLREIKKGQWQSERGVEDSGTETEGGGTQSEGAVSGSMLGSKTEGLLRPEDAQGALRKRMSSGEASSGDLSTDSDWDKVSEAGEVSR